MHRVDIRDNTIILQESWDVSVTLHCTALAPNSSILLQISLIHNPMLTNYSPSSQHAGGCCFAGVPERQMALGLHRPNNLALVIERYGTAHVHRTPHMHLRIIILASGQFMRCLKYLDAF